MRPSSARSTTSSRVSTRQNDGPCVRAGPIVRQPNTVLEELTRSALDSVLAAQHAGITVASRDGKVRTATATSQYPRVLDKIQERRHEGPCLSAAWKNHVVRIDDLTLEERWPAYCRDVAEETPIRSVMSFQLFTGQHSVGTLNFFAEQPHAFDDEAVETGAWHMLRRDQQFRSALASRDIIGQAKGMLMERFGIGAVQAFELLKRLSQESNTKLLEIAQQLIQRRQHGDGRN